MYSSLNTGAVRINDVDWDQAIDLASRHGFDGLDPLIGHPSVMRNPKEAGRKLRDAGLVPGGFGLGVQFREDEPTYKRTLEELPEHARAAEAMGCTRCITYILPFHDSLDYDANFKQHAKRLKPVAQILFDHGIDFGLEFVGPKTLRQGHPHAFIHDMDGILALIEEIAMPRVGVLLDAFHWHASGATARDITEKLAGKVVYVHVNDALPGRSPEEQVDNQRALPASTDVIDRATFMRSLRQIGYGGPIVAEPFLSFEGKSHDEIAAEVAACVKKFMAA